MHLTRKITVTGDTGAQSVFLLLLQSVCCSSFVCDHAFVHEQGVFGLQHVQGWVRGHRLWHVALEGWWPHPQKISATFTFKKWSKTLNFGSDRHGALVKSPHLKCSSALTAIRNSDLVN